MRCGCDSFSRSEALRRAAAQAGQGLPAIERGMPLPAGTGLDRRSFLARSAGLLLSVYGGSKLGIDALQEGIARAQSGPAQRVLVSVFLDGGADSMSILFPAGEPNYAAFRPTLALAPTAGTPFAEDNRLRWHPAAAPFAELHGEGKVSVLPAVGYTDVNQSHFTSRHYWEVGATQANLRTGWLGRYLDLVGTQDNPLQGLSLDHQLQPSLAAGAVPVATVEAPKEYDFWARGVWGEVQPHMLDAIGSLGSVQPAGDPALSQAAAAAYQTDQLRRQLSAFASGDTGAPPVAYPSPDEDFPQRLAALAAMIAAGLPLHCVALQAPGMYDTHDDQPAELSEGLKLTADSLLAFQRDLEARGIADRVLVHVWSEFGRRVKENGSNGTDHGAAGTGFLVGSRASGTMIGEFPGLAKLDEHGNLRATSDFRGLYSALLEQWLGADAEAIIPGARKFARPKVIR
jgi:uncharacterized protein (DUF1501 family)